MKYILKKVVIGLGLMSIVGGAVAEVNYPAKSVRLFVPAAPGGPTDMAARVYARSFEEISGTSVAVINQAGGGGVSAFQSVVRGRSDGSVLLFSNSGLHIANVTGRSPYAVQDYTVGAILGEVNEAYVVPADAPYNTLTEFIEYAKNQPEPLKVGIQMGGGSQLKAEALNHVAEGKLRIVDAGSEGQRIPMILSNQIEMTTFGVVNGLQYERSGDIKVLAVASQSPDPAAPNWATTLSQDIDIDLPLVFAVLLPQKVNENVIENLDEIHKKMIENSNFLTGFETISAVPNIQISDKAKEQQYKEAEKIKSLL